MWRCVACGHQPVEPEAFRCAACGFAPEARDGFPNFAPDAPGAHADYDPAFFAELARIEDGHFWFEARNRLILWALRRHAPTDARRFVEVGCGTGFLLRGVARAFPDWELTGGELHPEALAYARRRVPDARLVQADLRRLPFTEHADIIGVFDVLEHLDDDAGALRELYGALAPGGLLLATVPQHRFLWSAADEAARHKRRYARADLAAKIRAAGFTVLDATSFVSLLLPFMLAARIGKRRRVQDPMSEFRLPRALNAAFAGVLGMERALITGAGWRPALGGSRLIVARKKTDNGGHAAG